MPLTAKGQKILASMEEKYGAKKGEQVFYASANKGTITGVHHGDAVLADAAKLDAVVAACHRYDSKKDADASYRGYAKAKGEKNGKPITKELKTKAFKTRDEAYQAGEELADRLEMEGFDQISLNVKKDSTSKLDAMVAACDEYVRTDAEKKGGKTNPEVKGSDDTLKDKFLLKWQDQVQPSKVPSTLAEYLKTFDGLNMLRGRADYLRIFETDPKITAMLIRIRDKADRDRNAYGDKYWPRFMNKANRKKEEDYEDISNEKRKRNERNNEAYARFKKK